MRLSSVVTLLIGRSVLVLLLICAGVASVHAQQAGATNITASSIAGAAAIVVDGELSDAGWQSAVPVTTFVQRDPLEGAEPSFKTEARIVYDSSAIYVGVRAFDAEPARIVGFLTRRDAGSASDWIQVYIDSYYDRRTAYQFGVNPLGVKQDAYWFNENESDDSWDAVWDVVVRRNGGWMAGGVPDSVLAAAIQRQGRRAARVRDLAAGGASQRDVHLAVDLEERQRLGVVVRHAERRQHRQRVETSRARALHRCAGA